MNEEEVKKLIADSLKPLQEENEKIKKENEKLKTDKEKSDKEVADIKKDVEQNSVKAQIAHALQKPVKAEESEITFESDKPFDLKEFVA